MKKFGDQSPKWFREKSLLTNQLESPSKVTDFSYGNQESPEQQHICQTSAIVNKENNSHHQKLFLQSSLGDQPYNQLYSHSEEQTTEGSKHLQQITNENQSTPTDLVPTSTILLSTPDEHHQFYSYYNPDTQHQLFNDQYLKEWPQKHSKFMEQDLQKNFFHKMRMRVCSAIKKPSVNGKEAETNHKKENRMLVQPEFRNPNFSNTRRFNLKSNN